MKYAEHLILRTVFDRTVVHDLIVRQGFHSPNSLSSHIIRTIANPKDPFSESTISPMIALQAGQVLIDPIYVKNHWLENIRERLRESQFNSQ